MNGKQIKILLLLIILCFFIYSVIMVQLSNKLVELNIQLTELKEKESIIKSETKSITSNIKSMLSMENLNSIAEQKNFTPNKGRIIVLKNDKDKEE